MSMQQQRFVEHLEENFKYLLTVTTGLLPQSLLKRIITATHYVQLASWMKAQGFDFPRRVLTRDALFDVLIAEVADTQTLYLEFGVYRGDSIRYWSQGLRHSASQLHGFDSFEGLPESGWNWQQGQFDTQGKIPNVGDARVHFHKGWFDQTLPVFCLPEHARLVVNLDADLYSSTISVLRTLAPNLRTGTLIYLDDLLAADHEPRALEEFLCESGLVLEPVVALRSLASAAFRVTGSTRAWQPSVQ